VPDLPIPPVVADAVAEGVAAALGAFLRTTVGMVTLGVALAAGCFWYAGIAAAGIAVALGAIIGLVLAGKRAVLGGLAAVARTQGLSGRVVRALFERLGAVDSPVPLADAETRLRAAVADWVGGTGGGLRGRVQRALVRRIETITLARFREAGDTVSMARVGDELAARADALLLAQLAGAARRITMLLVAVTVVLACAAAVALRHAG
jgi:hypothetical protein